MPVADRIYRGGTIHTMDPMTPTTDAVAIDAGTIIAIGDANCTTATGPDTEVIDLNGRTLIPGFHDAHAHPVLGGLGMVECNLDDIHGYQPYLDRIAEYADEHPDDEWVLGSGWYGDVFTDGFPHRRDLDSVVSDRPASITSHDAHGTWVNTRALEVAGITRDTPDPDGGRIVKDAEGNPTGGALRKRSGTRHRPVPSEHPGGCGTGTEELAGLLPFAGHPRRLARCRRRGPHRLTRSIPFTHTSRLPKMVVLPVRSPPRCGGTVPSPMPSRSRPSRNGEPRSKASTATGAEVVCRPRSSRSCSTVSVRTSPALSNAPTAVTIHEHGPAHVRGR